MSLCAAATQKNSWILGIGTVVFPAALYLIYIITAWMLVTVLNISFKKIDYNEVNMYHWLSLKYRTILKLLTI